jgi:hypothetical protein
MAKAFNDSPFNDLSFNDLAFNDLSDWRFLFPSRGFHAFRRDLPRYGNARNAGPATPDLASLPGARTLRTSEPEKNSRLAEAVIKFLTGGEPIRARHLHRA